MVSLDGLQVCSVPTCRQLLPANLSDEPHAGYWVAARHPDGSARRYQRRCKECVRSRQREVAGHKRRGEAFEARRPALTAEQRNAARRKRHAERMQTEPGYGEQRRAVARENARRRRRAAGARARNPRSRYELDLLPVEPLRTWLLTVDNMEQLSRRSGVSSRKLRVIKSGYYWKHGKRYAVKNVSSTLVDSLLLAGSSRTISDLYPL